MQSVLANAAATIEVNLFSSIVLHLHLKHFKNHFCELLRDFKNKMI